jgi:hypothetical protein
VPLSDAISGVQIERTTRAQQLRGRNITHRSTLLFHSKGFSFLLADKNNATLIALRNVVIDKRLSYFDPELNTDKKSSATAKSAVRTAYRDTCVLCGKDAGAASWPLTIAHIVSNNSQMTYDEFGPPRYDCECDPRSIRNKIILCGDKTICGSCHNLFDHHNVIIYYHAFSSKYMSLCLLPMPGSEFSKLYEKKELYFPASFAMGDRPYRRLLAWRMRHAALKNASSLDKDRLDSLVRMSEFSEAAELVEDDCVDEGDTDEMLTLSVH